jgi:prophage regulatory protein
MKTFIRLREVSRITGLSRSTIYEGMAAGWFPKSFRLGPKAVAWSVDEINEYQERCMTRRYEAYAPAAPAPPTEKQKSIMALLEGGGLSL